MSRRNLLLCFDAFGTLFKPRKPIAQQYAAVARQCGLEGFTAEQVQASFKAAFSGESKSHPNYGRASGMGAETWWTNVIRKTFQPLIGAGRALPQDLAPLLLHRFSSSEGYALAPGVDSLLRTLKAQQDDTHKIIVGVITNSDDRVPSILTSLGLRVSPLRCGTPSESTALSNNLADNTDHDIDLHCMSYDVGFAKPDRRIFDAVEAAAARLITARGGTGKPSGFEEVEPGLLKLYVGDEYEKDIVGAREAGWNAVLVDQGADVVTSDGEGGKFLDLVEQLAHASLDVAFPQDGQTPVMIRAKSTQALLEWLIRRYEAGAKS